MLISLLGINALAIGNCDGAGNCYVSILATGTGSGADWANACLDFTGNCDVTSSSMRGTTIYVGGSPGNPVGPVYSAQNFSAPASGTTPITIIAASAANHGTDTGWRRQSGQAVVPFMGPISITTDHWIFNGQYRAKTINSTESQGGGVYHDQLYGYHMQVISTNKTSCAVQISGNNVSLSYMYIQGSAITQGAPGGNYGGTGTDRGICYAQGVSNEYVGYSWIGYTGTDLVSTLNGSNFTFEYDMFTQNHMGPATLVSQAISVGDVSGLIIRYSHFQDITGNGILSDPYADATAFTPNWYIYGNDIWWDSRIKTGAGYGIGGGLVNLVGETLNGGVINVYNNTFAGINAAACGVVQPCAMLGMNLTGLTSGGSCASHNVNCIGATAPVGSVLNNLWWNPFAATNWSASTSAQWQPTGDYGEGICPIGGCSNNGTFVTRAPNDFATMAPNPFKSFSGVIGNPNWYTFNFQVTSNTAGGILPNGAGAVPPGCNSSFNCEVNDPNMVTLGANGTIQRGAFQINPRVLLSVGVVNEAVGLHIGGTFQEVPVCKWSAPPTPDDCPDGNPPFVKQWISLDDTVATVSSTGLVTAVSARNSFVNLHYGGLTSDNSIVILVTDGQGAQPLAALPTGIVRTGTPLAFASYDTSAFDAAFPTTYNPPTGGHTWRPTTADELISNLNSSAPGDVIVLQAGTIYATSKFYPFPARSNPNHLWTYIISSNEASLPPQGTRIRPSDAVNMPKLVTLGGNSLVVAAPGSDHWWISGVEMYSQSTIGGCPTCNPPGNPVTYSLVIANTPDTPPSAMPDSITIDRCYLHNDSAHDIFHIIMMNASHFAVLDSIAMIGSSYQAQAQADTSYFTPGPIKIINNLFSAFGEDALQGGAGGLSNMWVLRDAYFSHNTFWNNPAYKAVGVTIPPLATYNYNNNFELKICQRCLIDGNVMQNSWGASQEGGQIVLNAGTGVNGPDAVINDITFSNNILTGGLQGMGAGSFAANLNGCGQFAAPCFYPGESQRVNFFNNLYIMGPQGPPGGRSFIGSNSIAQTVNRSTVNHLWQHNTYVGPYLTDHAYCDDSFFFNPVTSGTGPTDIPPTQNVWFLDNVMCRQMRGASSLKGTALLNLMMADPSTVPINTRFYGNVMQVFTSQGDTVDTYPPNNINTTSNFVYVSPTTGNYQLQSPIQSGSDGRQTGIDYATLMAHQAPPLGNCSVSGVVSGGISSGVAVTLTGDATATVYSNPDGTYNFPRLAAGNFVVTPNQLGYSFNPVNVSVTNQTCVTGSVNFSTTALPTYTITGTITFNSNPLAGVTVHMTGEDIGTATTDASGNYSFTGLLQNSGTHTMAPSLTGYSFSPMSASQVIRNASLTQNFTASQSGATTYSISGSITGPIVSGMTISLSGAANATTTSNSTGFYIFNGLANGSYTLTPSRSGYTFSPTRLSAVINGADISGDNFAATQVIQPPPGSNFVASHIGPGTAVQKKGDKK